MRDNNLLRKAIEYLYLIFMYKLKHSSLFYNSFKSNDNKAK